MVLRQSVRICFVISLIIMFSACIGLPNQAPNKHRDSTPTSNVEAREIATMRQVSFATTEGTWMALDVSPDGRMIVFDLLGDLYLMPIEGGDAVPLTSGQAWDQSPRFSPDGQEVFFISDRVGRKNLWRVSLDNQIAKQVTRLKRHVVGAINFSHDHRSMLAGIAALGMDYQNGAEVLLHFIDPASGAITPIEPWTGPVYDTSSGLIRRVRSVKQTFSGSGAGAGRDVFFSEFSISNRDDGVWQFRVGIHGFNGDTQSRYRVTDEDVPYSEFKPELSHDGTLLAYFRQYDDRRTELRLLELKSDRDRLLVRLENAEDALYSITDDHRPNYAFTPDDRALIFWHAGEIRRVNLADAESEAIPFRVNVVRDIVVRAEPVASNIKAIEEAKTIRWPSLSRNGQTLIFVAAGHIWAEDLASGELWRLTEEDEFAFMPTISPDGSSVAYTSISSNWKDYTPRGEDPFSLERGRLMVVDIVGHRRREVLSAPETQFMLPQWSEDGAKIATLRKTHPGPTSEWTVGWANAEGGGFNEVLTLPTRHVFPEGKSLYSRWVGFDRSGKNLVFSYPVSPETTLLSMADLDGGQFQILAAGASDVGGITPSPGLTSLLLTRRDGTLWKTPFELETEPKALSTFTPNVTRLSESGGYYSIWYGDDQLSFGFGRKFYQYDLNTSDLTGREVGFPIIRPMSSKPIAFVGARLVTLTESDTPNRIIENGVLLVDHGRIKAIGEEVDVELPNETQIIDVAGLTIVPGFIDTHYHDMGGTSTFNFPFSGRLGDRSAMKYGMTSAWDPGSRNDDAGAAHSDLQTSGRVLGPRWSYTSGILGFPYAVSLIDTSSSLEIVGRSDDLGVVVAKEYNATTRSQQQQLSSAARSRDLGVVAHLDRFDMTMTRIVDGYTGADHQYLPIPFYEDVYQFLLHSEFIWTPNIATTTSSVSTSDRSVSTYYCDAVDEARRQEAFVVSKAISYCDMVMRRDALPEMETHRAGRVARQVALAAEAGVKIGVSAHNRPAYNLHVEMWALNIGGMPEEEVLRATSMTNAEKLGLQNEIGSLEVGKIADFVVLEANPLDSILNTMSLRYTVQFGVIYDSETAEPVDPETLAVIVH